jgi:hypothetical protein
MRSAERPGEIRVSQTWLIKHLSDFLKERKKVSPSIANAEAQALLEVISERSGLLLPRGEEADGTQWAFSHLSFQEYFAAQRLRRAVRSPGWVLSEGIASPSSLRQYAGRDLWREAFVLLFEGLAEDEAEDTSWSDYLAEVLFECRGNSTRKDIKFSEPRNLSNLVSLGTGIVIDTHSGLTRSIRLQIATMLWTCYFNSLDDGGGIPVNVLQTPNKLLSSTEFKDVIYEALSISSNLTRPQKVLAFKENASSLSPLFSIPKLNEVIIIGPPTQADIDAISSNETIKSISLSSTAEVSLRPLACLKTLTSLSIMSKYVKADIIYLFSEISTLEYLGLREFDDKVLGAALATQVALKRISIGLLTNQVLIRLKEAKNLTHLRFSKAEESANLKLLEEIPSLQEVSIESQARSQISKFVGINIIVRLPDGRIWHALNDPAPKLKENTLNSKKGAKRRN